MTVSTASPRVTYTGAGTTGPFAIPYYFLENDDLKVVRTTIATGAESTLALTTDYTITGAGDPAGGALTLITSLSSAYKLTIIRDPDLLQSISYPRNDKFPSATHEKALDKLTMLAQRVYDIATRAFRLSDGDTTTSVVLPQAVANRALKWNGTATGLANSAYDPDTLQSAAAASAAAAAVSESAAAASATASSNSAIDSSGYATNASNSAAAAAATLASALWRDVVFKTIVDSPVNVVQGDNGKLFVIDTAGGSVVVNLPQISATTMPFTVGIKKETSDANTVTVNRAGTDTIDGAASKVYTVTGGGQFIADVSPSPDIWTEVTFGSISAGLITASGLTQSTAKMLGRSTAGSGAIEELSVAGGLTISGGSLSAGFASGTFTTASLASSGVEEGPIAHGLGTDDIDFGFSLIGSDAAIVNSVLCSGALIGTDKRVKYVGSTGSNTPTSLPSAGNLNYLLRNGSGVTQTVTVKWWARKR
jgi:hypothetical protein